jgi:TusA-related sulfurtransferase
MLLERMHMRIDVRDLEPPQPMIRVVQALEKLQEGEVLEVLGSRPFTHLLPRLSEMGYEYQLEETEEGYLLKVWHSGKAKEEKLSFEEPEFEINEDTNVGKLLERFPQALEILIKYGFTPLKNPLLRKILPYTVSLKQAKKIRRMSDEKFQEMLRELKKLTER